MWNKKRSTFLLVKIKVPSRFSFNFPLLLPLVEETMEELTDWMAFWKWVHNREGSWVSNLWSGLHMGQELFGEIRSLGPMDMVEINTPEALVAVKLR